MVRESRAWLFLLLSVALVGCYATVSQVLIIREFLVVFFGNELCLGTILGAWLFGVAVGAATGGRIVGRLREPMSAFLFVLVLMCVMLPPELILIRVLRHVLNVQAGQYIPIVSLLLSSLFIITPFSFAIGFMFPVACRVIRGFTRDSAADIGFVYILESIGSLIGGLLFTFVLISRFQPFSISLILECMLFSNIFLILLFSERRIFKKRGFFACLLLFFAAFILLVSGWVNKIDDYFVNVRWSSSNPDITLLESIDSKYENIVIGVRDDQYSVFGNGQFTFAFPDDYENSQVAHLVMTQHPLPERVLLIGGGMGGMIREMLKHPVHELDYIEPDPVLIETTGKYLSSDEAEALSDSRVKIFHVDGRYFVKRADAENKYDVILVNVPDPSTAFLNRFYTLQFFQECSRILEKDGVFVTGISSSVNYLGEEMGNYTGSIYRTLHKVFPHVIVSPGQTNYYFAGNLNGTATFNIETLSRRYIERGIKSEYFSEYVFYTLLEPDRVRFIENELRGRKGLRLNTDTKPVTYFFNLMLWDKLSGSRFGSVLQWFERSRLKTFLIPVFVFLACRIVYVIVFRRSLNVQHKFNSITAIATTGFAAMALEIILIYAFQNIYGYVYEKIGLIIAVFMFGLALGGGLGNRLILRKEPVHKLNETNPVTERGVKSEPHHGRGDADSLTGTERLSGKNNEHDETVWAKKLMALEVIIVVYACIIPFILDRCSSFFSDSEYLFMFLVVMTGVLTGFAFPISSKLYFMCKGAVGTTSGTINSADHAGAFMGAILTGVLFVPIFGITGSCVIIAGLNLMSLLLLGYSFFQKSKVSRKR